MLPPLDFWLCLPLCFPHPCFFPPPSFSGEKLNTCEALLLTVSEVWAHLWSQRVSEITMLLLCSPCDGWPKTKLCTQTLKQDWKLSLELLQRPLSLKLMSGRHLHSSPRRVFPTPDCGGRNEKCLVHHSQPRHTFACLFGSSRSVSSTCHPTQTLSMACNCFASQHTGLPWQDLGHNSSHTGMRTNHWKGQKNVRELHNWIVPSSGAFHHSLLLFLFFFCLSLSAHHHLGSCQSQEGSF